MSICQTDTSSDMMTIERSSDEGGNSSELLSSTAKNTSNLFPSSSSSSSSFARTDSGTLVEIAPPPVLQRSAEEDLLLQTTTTSSSSTVSAFSLGTSDQFSSFHTNNNGGGSGVINVDNIFSAMLDDTPHGNNNNNINNNSAMNNITANNHTSANYYISRNNILHNFTSSGDTTNNNNNDNEALSILIAPKKSSLLHNGSGSGNVITAYNPTNNLVNTTNTTTVPSRQSPLQQHHHHQQQQHQRHNSFGTTPSQTQPISKSMNTTTASFLRPIISHSESNDQYDSQYHGNPTMSNHHGTTTSHNGGGVAQRRNSGHLYPRPFYGTANSSIITGSRVRLGSREDVVGNIHYNTNNNRRRMSSGMDVPRHAGYLLKRSNNPYVDASSAAASAVGGGHLKVVDGTVQPPPPVQELLLNSFDGSGIEPLYTLPFGGVDSIVEITDTTTSLLVSNNIAAAADMGYDYDEDSIENNEEEEDLCFCAPLLQLLTGRRNQWRETYPIMSEKKKKKKSSDFGSPIIDSRRDYQQQQQEQQLLQDVVVSQIPLKEPARSDPVPIGGEQQQQQQQQSQHFSSSAASGTNSADIIESEMATNRSMNRLMSRSYSNGSRLNETTSTLNKVSIIKSTTSVTSTTATKKEYPPPPPDYIDPRDGHIWRAKYCVLEDGILYFYRNAMEGESDEAEAERNESRHFHHAATTTTTTTMATTSTVVTMSPSLGGLSSSPSMPIPIDSSAGKTASTVTTADSSTRTSLSKMGKKDLFDLSKSPMPMKKSDFFHLRVPSSSSINQTGGNASLSAATPTATPTNNNMSPTSTLRQSPVLLHHSNSTSTFHNDTDILWEKRVALDCVGAVRSSVQDHGDHAFELLAYGNPDGDEQSDASTRNSGEHPQQQHQQHEIIDRLILRAGSSDDMNTWMFQFHRSLASYMRQIVNSALNNRANVMRMRPDSPVHQLYQHRRIGTPVGSTTMSKHKQQHSSSPLGASSFGSGYSPGTGPSLSHGHGRNALYRRKVRDDAFSPTPVGSPESFAKSERSDSVESQKKAVAVLGLRDVRKSIEGVSSSPISAAATAAPRKYIPPQLRKAAPTKYIPPHLRKKMEKVTKVSKEEGEIAISVEKQIPLNDSIVDDDDGIKAKRVKSQTREDDGAESDTPSDSALSATSSLLSRQMDDISDAMLSSSNVRRGGCADPTVILGSILDDIFIPRKASVLEKARLQPHGCIGGGLFTSVKYATVEEDIIPFDDVMNNTGRRSFLSGLKWEVGASSECGVRNSNEDSYVVINNLDEMIASQGLTSFAAQDVGQTKQQGLFAIFDGHVGNQAARFSAEKFPDMLMEEQSALASRDSAILSSIEDRTLEVLRNAFDRLDREFCSLCTRDGRDWDCGSTALAALVVDDVVTLANLGDCRGVVCRVVSSDVAKTDDAEWQELDPEDDEDMLWDRANGAFSSGERLFWREVTETHSPLLGEEEERIKAANGWIIHETEIPTGQIHRMDFFDEDVVDIVKRCFADRLGQHRSDPARSIQIARTCGDLAVSRAIGDRDFKAAYNLPQKIASVSETQTITEQRAEIAMSWDGPPVFIYPEDHSKRFKGDLVSNVPDIKFFKIGQEGVVDEFLLMACDGLWDVMDGDDAVRIAKNLLFDKKLSAKDGAERLAELAKHLGSSDNITVILIRFYWEEIDKK
eukprot:scaffold14726_cov146-Skeletonema_menzelii.AAC.2